MIRLWFTLLGLSLTPAFAWAGGCCGGGVSSASVITGDERQMLATELSLKQTTRQATAWGAWQDKRHPESVQTLSLQFARIFRDRFQLGASVQTLRRESGVGQSTGLGDSTLSFGYEALPEWEYSRWKPRGHVYLSAVVPTGRANDQSENDDFLDVRGRGFWSFDAGAILTKTRRAWDAALQLEAHRSLARSLRGSVGGAEAVPGWGGTVSVGLGYTRNPWRVGLGVSHMIEEPVRITGQFESSGSATQSTNLQLLASYRLVDQATLLLRYIDPALIGQPIGVDLGKAVALALIYRWDR